MFTFLIAAIAGAATPMAEPHFKSALEQLMLDDIQIGPNEFRALAFATMLVIAALIATLGGGGSALGLAIGGLLGLFGKRIFDVIRNKSGA